MSKAKHDEQIYNQVVDHWLTFSLPPTIQYLVDHTPIQSKSNIWLALVRLEKARFINVIQGKAIPVAMSINIKENK